MRYDNRADNLRIVTRSVNNRNITKRSDNKSGTKGIRIDHKGRFRYWKAEIVNNEGITITKCFNIDKFGDERAKELAFAQRRLWEQEYGYIGD